jgi:phenylalanyl-tRNA synthetase alpha chain
MALLTELEQLVDEARRDSPRAQTSEAAEALRVKYLGKKGKLSALLRGMGKLTPEERPAAGEAVNRAKEEIEGLLDSALKAGRVAALGEQLRASPLDITLPGRRFVAQGKRHPISTALDEVLEIFARLGFEAVEGPEVEIDYYNFEALNLPQDHPARDMQDTFYVEAPAEVAATGSRPLLRTHTSPVQIRTMLGRAPPLRIVSPGRVYRRDDDPTHTPMFHQVECLCVDRGISMVDLKGTLEQFLKAFFGSSVRMRLRPSYFPFVEPGVEVDMTCLLCNGKGCPVCKGSGFLEILGAGMIHPKVLENGGYDPEQVSGFAFGAGIDRFAMLRYGVNDLRLFFENDLRFLGQL